MYRLYRLVPALIVIFSLTVLATRASERSQPSPAAVLFTNADGTACTLPCLFGIQPDKTPFNEALGLLRAHPFLGLPKAYKENFDYTRSRVLSFSASWSGAEQYVGEDLGVYVAQGDSGMVSALEFYVEPICTDGQSGVLLGDVVNFLGTPRMTLDRNGALDKLYLFYDNSIVLGVMPEGQGLVETVYHPRPNDCLFFLAVQGPHDEPDSLTWCGFSLKGRLCGR